MAESGKRRKGKRTNQLGAVHCQSAASERATYLVATKWNPLLNQTLAQIQLPALEHREREYVARVVAVEMHSFHFYQASTLPDKCSACVPAYKPACPTTCPTSRCKLQSASLPTWPPPPPPPACLRACLLAHLPTSPPALLPACLLARVCACMHACTSSCLPVSQSHLHESQEG